jgi:hypothetical protein
LAAVAVLVGLAVIQYLAQLHQQAAAVVVGQPHLSAVRVVVRVGLQVAEQFRAQQEQQDKEARAEVEVLLLPLQAAVVVQVPLAYLVVQVQAEMVELEQLRQ